MESSLLLRCVPNSPVYLFLLQQGVGKNSLEPPCERSEVMDAKKALGHMVSLVRGEQPCPECGEALAVLSALVEESAALKADFEYKNEQLGACILRAEKAEAELERFKAECLSHFRGRDGLGTCGDKCQWYPGDGQTCPMSRDGLMRDLEKAEAELTSLRSEAERARPLLDIRSEVVAFARLMEDRLQVNEHKGGWKNCQLDWLLERLKGETAELEHELNTGNYIWVDKEAADVGNFAMMITDVAGRLAALAYRARVKGEPDSLDDGLTPEERAREEAQLKYDAMERRHEQSVEDAEGEEKP